MSVDWNDVPNSPAKHLTVQCPCGAKMRIPAAAAGRKARCPKCGKLFRVPSRKASVGRAESSTQSTAPAEDAGGLMYAFAKEEKTAPPVARRDPIASPPPARGASGSAAGPTCKSCGETMPVGAKVCVNCGINLKTGRSLITTQEDTLDRSYIVAENTIRVISIFCWTGLYPIASEAFGTARPHVIRGVAIALILASVVFWMAEINGSTGADNLMLWCGTTDVDALIGEDELTSDELAEVTAALDEHRRNSGQQHAYQFITHAFLHADPFHLAGNLLFLMVFGTRVNALAGNVWTMALYPALAVAAGVAYSVSAQDDILHPMLGASGAVMGMAGMYLVFFPVHKVHMAFWFRLFFWFPLKLKFFTVRGFWVVLFYMAFDVIYTVIGMETGVAHWAHLGGFGFGVLIAVALLLARLVNARGGDIISVTLGRHAWGIVGRPKGDAA